MKTFIILLFVLFLVNGAQGLGCLPEGLIITSQIQIDSFQYNYPGCTEIEGNVMIGGLFANITNLNGLSALTSFGGDLTITILGSSDLSGLENVSNIAGTLSILGNWSLKNLTGLDNLKTIGGNFRIGEGFGINNSGNDSLTTLTGLGNLTSIGGCLNIEGNDNLENVSGLNALNYVGGGISILGNNSLKNLAGLDNINANSITDLTISKNTSLSNCNVQSICNYLSDPNGIVDILDNSPGCNSPPEIAGECGITLPCLPYGNYYFFSQADLDNFQTNYPGCTELGGNVTITGNDIVNINALSQITAVGGRLLIGEPGGSIVGNPLLGSLVGLENLTQIGGDLWFGHNDSLTSFTGLDNLSSIGGSLLIGLVWNVYTPQWSRSIIHKNMGALTSISALSNLTAIPGELYISETDLASLSGLENIESLGGHLRIFENSSLASLSALSNLHSIRGMINIDHNDVLVSLAGMDNIIADSISSLWIKHNSLLSACEVRSVCDYLQLPIIDTWIKNNAQGCNSQQEIADSCTKLGIESIPTKSSLHLYPNPTSSTITIESTVKGMVSIMNLNNYYLLQQEFTEPKTTIDVKNLPAGFYFVTLKNENTIEVRKLIKE